MGVVNVTPDSFSDGGEWFEPAAAVAHGLRAARRRAPTCSTSAVSPPGPAPQRPPSEEELRRVLPVVAELAAAGRAGLGRHHARRGRRPGPAGRRQHGQRRQRRPGRPRHGRASSPTPGRRTSPCTGARTARTCSRSRRTTTWSQDVCRELTAAGRGPGGRGRPPRADRARPRVRASPSWPPTTGALLAHLDRVQALGFPVLVGTSRKSFLGRLGVPAGDPPPTGGRARRRHRGDHASSPRLAGAWGVRVHHVPSSLDALRVVARDGGQAR